MSGFPTRPDRGAFGPTLIDRSPVRDTEGQVGASRFNLDAHQVAGLGLVSPRVMLRLTIDGTTPVLISRAEVWNPKGLSTGDQVPPTLAGISTGRCTVSYPTTIADEEGDPIGIGFAWGCGIHGDDPPTVLQHIRVAPIAATPSIVTVTAFNAAGALEDGVDATVFLW